MGTYRDRNLLITSAGFELAKKWSQSSRDILAEYADWFGVKMNKADQGASDWQTVDGGECRAIGVGGSLFGFGAHVILIDDYHGSIEKALSNAERDTVHRWYHGTIRNRLNDEHESSIVIIATPYHRDDLMSRLLKEQEQGGDTWDVIKLPAIAEGPDLLGRNEGEPLWPEKWSIAHLTKERNALAMAGYPWMFDALYQCNPADALDSEFSGYINENCFFDEWPKQTACRVMYIDPSLGKSDKSDYSAIILAAVDVDGMVWIDADLSRRPSTQIAADAIQWHRKFKPDAMAGEANGFQELMLAEIQRIADQEREDICILGVHNSTDKRVRIRRLTPLLAQGRIKFRRNSPGVNLLMEQLKGFPGHKYDDGPDALEGAIRVAGDLLQGSVTRIDPENEVLTA